MLIGIINGTGFGTFFSTLLQPLLGSIPGLLVLGIICSIPGLSAILGPGAVISQILGGIMGAEIAAGRETVEVGVMSVMYSRFITSWIRVLLAVVFSIGMYAA